MERKKIWWIIITVGATLTIILLVGLVFISGGNARKPYDPASLSLKSSPRIPNPEDYVKPGASLSPSPSPAASPNGDLVVVFGQDPAYATPSAQTTPMPSGQVPLTPDSSPAPSGWASSKPVLSPSPTPRAPAQTASKAPASKPAAKSAGAASVQAPKLVSITEYWIQTASFKSKGKAEQFKADLSSSGLSSIIRTKEVDGVTMYQVRVGPYSSSKEANGWLVRIRKLADCGDAYISKTKAKHSI